MDIVLEELPQVHADEVVNPEYDDEYTHRQYVQLVPPRPILEYHRVLPRVRLYDYESGDPTTTEVLQGEINVHETDPFDHQAWHTGGCGYNHDMYFIRCGYNLHHAPAYDPDRDGTFGGYSNLAAGLRGIDNVPNLTSDMLRFGAFHPTGPRIASNIDPFPRIVTPPNQLHPDDPDPIDMNVSVTGCEPSDDDDDDTDDEGICIWSARWKKALLRVKRYKTQHDEYAAFLKSGENTGIYRSVYG